MPRIRGVSRKKVQHRDANVPGNVYESRATGDSTDVVSKAVKNDLKQHIPSGYLERGRTIWAVYCAGGGRYLVRAPKKATTQDVRELFLAAVDPPPKEFTAVQAGGFGRFYDADDCTRPVDFDFSEGE